MSVQVGDSSSRADPRDIPTLDGWRAIAIILVMICHSADRFPNRGFIDIGGGRIIDLRVLGLLGVQIFFALSGFLITTRLVQEERGSGRISLARFYRRRAFRILPAAFALLLVVGALSWIGVLPVTLARWLSALFFFANYSSASPSWYLGHFWSLAVEEHFYLVWPIVFLLAARPRSRLTCVVIAILLVTMWRAVAWKFGIATANPEMFWGRSDVVADNLLFGVASGLIYAEDRWWARWRSRLASKRLSASLAALIVATTLFEPRGWKSAMMFWSLKAAAIPLWLGGSVLRAQSGGASILDSPVMRWVGRLSYSLYLWQQLFLVWDDFRVPALRLVQRIPGCYACAVACAYASYRWVEKPMIRLGRSRIFGQIGRSGPKTPVPGLRRL